VSAIAYTDQRGQEVLVHFYNNMRPFCFWMHIIGRPGDEETRTNSARDGESQLRQPG